MDLLRACAWLTLSFALGGCQDDPHRPGGGPGCAPGAACGINPVGGAGTQAGSGAGGAGGGGSVELSGTVRVLDDAAFAQSSLFTGKATVSAPKAGGGTVSGDYGSLAGTSFALKDVQGGDDWVRVEVEDAGAEVFSSWSVQHAPDDAAELPLVDRAVVIGIASTITGQPTLEQGAAHIAIALEHEGEPLEGISVDGGTAGALILYDTGLAGEYTAQATATGKAGRILLLNATPPGSETITIAIQDSTGMSLPGLPVMLGADSVTLVGFEL